MLYWLLNSLLHWLLYRLNILLWRLLNLLHMLHLCRGPKDVIINNVIIPRTALWLSIIYRLWLTHWLSSWLDQFRRYPFKRFLVVNNRLLLVLNQRRCERLCRGGLLLSSRLGILVLVQCRLLVRIVAIDSQTTVTITWLSA